MNYQLQYDKLIVRAKSRILDGYVERHHILPRCMGGSEDLSNIVPLTAREHFVAHQLLVKIYPAVGGLIAAVSYLTANNSVRNNRMYEWLRIKHAKQMSLNNKGKKMTPEQIAKVVAVHKGSKRSAETCAKIAAKATGRKASSSTKLVLSNAHKKEHANRKLQNLPHHNSGKLHSEEHNKKIGEAIKGRKQTPEHIAKRAEARRKTLELRKAL